MKIFKKMYEFVLFIEIFLFFIFILDNINNLDEIEFSFVLNNEITVFTINMYSLLAVLAVVFGILVLAGTNIFGFGLNDTATKMVSKYITGLLIFSTLTLGVNYYILPLGWLGVLFNVFIIIIYFLHSLTSFTSSEVDYNG